MRALVHKADARSEQLRASGVEIVEGDLLDFEAVSEALKGITGAYFVYPIQVPGILDATAFFAQAALEQGVSATVNMSRITASRVMRVALAWNALGLLALTNVVIRAVLTAPGLFNLIHAEVPNLMLGTFPFLFIPGFFVPLAVVLRVLAIRAISSRLRTAISGAVASDRASPKLSATPFNMTL